MPRYLIKAANFVAEISNDDELLHLAEVGTVKRDTKVRVIDNNTERPWTDAGALPFLTKVWGVIEPAVMAVSNPKMPPVASSVRPISMPPRLATVVDYRPDFVPPVQKSGVSVPPPPKEAPTLRGVSLLNRTSRRHELADAVMTDEEKALRSGLENVVAFETPVGVVGDDDVSEDEKTVVSFVPDEPQTTVQKMNLGESDSVDVGAPVRRSKRKRSDIARMLDSVLSVGDKDRDEDDMVVGEQLEPNGNLLGRPLDVWRPVEKRASRSEKANEEVGRDKSSQDVSWDDVEQTGADRISESTESITERNEVITVKPDVDKVDDAKIEKTIENIKDLSEIKSEKTERENVQDVFGEAVTEQNDKVGNNADKPKEKLQTDVISDDELERIGRGNLVPKLDGDEWTFNSNPMMSIPSMESILDLVNREAATIAKKESDKKHGSASLRKELQAQLEARAHEKEASGEKASVEEAVGVRKVVDNAEDKASKLKAEKEKRIDEELNSQVEDIRDGDLNGDALKEAEKTLDELLKPSYIQQEVKKSGDSGLGSALRDGDSKLVSEGKEKSLEAKPDLDPDGMLEISEIKDLAKSTRLPSRIHRNKQSKQTKEAVDEKRNEERKETVGKVKKESKEEKDKLADLVMLNVPDYSVLDELDLDDLDDDDVTHPLEVPDELKETQVSMRVCRDDVDIDDKDEKVSDDGLKAVKSAIDAVKLAKKRGVLSHDILERAESLVEALEQELNQASKKTKGTDVNYDEIPRDLLDESPSESFMVMSREELKRIHDIIAKEEEDSSSRRRIRSELRRMLAAEAKAAEAGDAAVSGDAMPSSPNKADIRSLFAKEGELHLYRASIIRDEDAQAEKEKKDAEKSDPSVKKPEKRSLTDELPVRPNRVVVQQSSVKQAESTLVTKYATLSAELVPDTFEDSFFKDKLDPDEEGIAHFDTLWLTTHRLWNIIGTKKVERFSTYDVENIQFLGIKNKGHYLYLFIDILALVISAVLCLISIYFSDFTVFGYHINLSVCIALLITTICLIPILYLLSEIKVLQFGLGSEVFMTEHNIDKHHLREASEFMNRVDAVRRERKRILGK